LVLTLGSGANASSPSQPRKNDGGGALRRFHLNERAVQEINQARGEFLSIGGWLTDAAQGGGHFVFGEKREQRHPTAHRDDERR
jgi:hypothetical protein